jgi:hypothetical protein
MLSLIGGDPSAVVRYSGLLILSGMLLAFASVQCDTAGAITGTFAIALGAAGGSLARWRTERGLWMLAVLFLTIYCAIYVLVSLGQILDWIRGVRNPEPSLIIDFSFGTILLSAIIRFLAKVARQNWNSTRPSNGT